MDGKNMEILTNEKIIETWKKVFPNSLMTCKRACLTKSCVFFDGYLSKGKDEFPYGIAQNDALGYCFEVEAGNYKEHYAFALIKPNNQYVAYSRDKIRKKSIKNVTVEKLEKRFLEVKAFIVKNKDNFINLGFDINDKI